MDKLDAMTSVVRLDDLPELSSKILKGQIRSRTVVDVRAWVSGDVRKSSLDDTRKGPPDDVAGVKDGRHGDNFSFL